MALMQWWCDFLIFQRASFGPRVHRKGGSKGPSCSAENIYLGTKPQKFALSQVEFIKKSISNYPATFNDIKHADSIQLPPLFFLNVLKTTPHIAISSNDHFFSL